MNGIAKKRRRRIDPRWALATALVLGPCRVFGGDPILERLRACMEEPDDAKRLACYDQQIGRAKSGQNEDLGVTGELLRQKRREAGAIQPATPQMKGKIVAIATAAFGKLVVTLDNGQVWAQQDVLTFPVAVGDVVTIRGGMLGVLWMVNAGGRIETRVMRIK